jgi:hypothetical protein
MNCPKCEGGAYVSEEEVVNVVENTIPAKVILKVIYVCKSCSERFTRVYLEDIDAAARKKPKDMLSNKPKEWSPAPGMPTSEFAAGPPVPKSSNKEMKDKLRFLDEV